MKRKVLRRRLFMGVIICICTLVFMLNSIEVKGNDTSITYKTIEVKNGDTIWNIVKDNCTNYKDIRKAIHDIKAFNNMTSSNIYTGQEIKIPLKLCKQGVK